MLMLCTETSSSGLDILSVVKDISALSFGSSISALSLFYKFAYLEIVMNDLTLAYIAVNFAKQDETAVIYIEGKEDRET